MFVVELPMSSGKTDRWRSYRNDPRISSLTDLVEAYQQDDIHRYESILQKNQGILEDPFIAENINEVTRNIRSQAMLKLIAPYTRFTLAFVAKKLNVPVDEVQEILAFLILDEKFQGKINQHTGMVQVDDLRDAGRLQALQGLASAVKSLQDTTLGACDPTITYERLSARRTGMPPGIQQWQLESQDPPPSQRGGNRLIQGRS